MNYKKFFKSKSLLIASASAVMATISGGVNPCYAWEFVFIGQSGSDYTYGLLSTASDLTFSTNDALSFTNLFPGATLTASGTTSTGPGFNPSPLPNVPANLLFGTSAQSFQAINNGTAGAPNSGISTLVISAPGATLGTIGVTFSGNTLINPTVQGPVSPSVVPFDFSSTPGLMAIGAIFGLKKGLDRLKAKK